MEIFLFDEMRKNGGKKKGSEGNIENLCVGRGGEGAEGEREYSILDMESFKTN